VCANSEATASPVGASSARRSGAGAPLGRGGRGRGGEHGGGVEADRRRERGPDPVEPAGDALRGQAGGARQVAVLDLVGQPGGGADERARGGQPSRSAGAGHDGRPREAAQRAGTGGGGLDLTRLRLDEHAQQQDVVAGQHPLGLPHLVPQRQAEAAQVRLPAGVQLGSQV
jgi:hypothetical protein